MHRRKLLESMWVEKYMKNRLGEEMKGSSLSLLPDC
jgi:hypothetical protein